MTYGAAFPQHVPPAKPPMIGWDVTLSVIVLVLTGVVDAFGVLFGAVSVVFLDYCPPERCSVGGVLASVGLALVVTLVVAFAGLALTVVRIARRRISWPVSVATLVLCVLVLVLGGAGYIAAAGVT